MAPPTDFISLRSDVISSIKILSHFTRNDPPTNTYAPSFLDSGHECGYRGARLKVRGFQSRDSLGKPHILELRAYRFRANMAHIRQSRPDSCLGFQVKALDTFQGVPSSLGSGYPQRRQPPGRSPRQSSLSVSSSQEESTKGFLAAELRSMLETNKQKHLRRMHQVLPTLPYRGTSLIRNRHPP